MNGGVFAPSFFGLITWVLAYALYMLKIIPWYSTFNISNLIFLAQILSFVISTCVFAKAYQSIKPCNSLDNLVPDTPLWLIYLLQFIGFVGILKYANDFSSFLDSGFFGTLFSDPLQIRALGAEMTSVGLQISYFGWMAIAATLCHSKPPTILCLLSLIQLFANLIFVDRTRPIWVLLTVLLCLFWTKQYFTGLRVIRWLLIIGAAFVALFVAFAIVSGKVTADTPSGEYNPFIENLYIYITSGFSYFNHIIVVESPGYLPTLERVFSPLYTVLSSVGLTDSPPDQILEFYEVPYPTNVGTMLEPFYRDGNISFVFLGIFIYSFGFDALGLWFLKQRSAFAVYAWATLCFCNFIGFFTAKIGNAPVWLFLFIGFISSITWKRPPLQLNND